MTAALTIADAGYSVHLAEKTANLGGTLREMYSTAEGIDPQAQLQHLVDLVLRHTRISIHYNTQLTSFAGRLGSFHSRLEVKSNGGAPQFIELDHGVTIVATGGHEFRGKVLFHGEHPGVVTQMELDKQLARDPEAARKLRQVVMQLCVDAPDQASHYCSRTCCTYAVGNAVRLKQLNPECQVILLYKDLMTYGFREAFYTEARRQGVLFLRYTDDQPPQVQISGGRIEVKGHDLALDQPLTLTPDLLVLSTAVQPADTNVTLAHLLGVPLSREGFFQEDNLKLRPMDCTRQGIFLAGLAHHPKFIEESISQALAVASRAVAVLSKSHVEAGAAIAVVDQAKCVGCLTCVRVCPFQVPKVDRGAIGVGRIVGAAYIEPSICTGCGICTSECPANAIQLRHHRDDQWVIPEEPILGQWLVA
jgi:heterodisulfide reductase subunit A